MAEVIIESDNQIRLYVNEGIPSDNGLTPDNEAIVTNKTISYADNTLEGVQPTLESGVNIKTISNQPITGAGNIEVLTPNLGGGKLTNVGGLSFDQQKQIATPSGAIAIDWSTGQNQRQASPAGGITYTFTPPSGVCHLQLFIAASASVYAFVFPASVKWLYFTWQQAPSKNAIINFWYDGTNYWAMGSNEA
jgi:hypothetical protein